MMHFKHHALRVGYWTPLQEALYKSCMDTIQHMTIESFSANADVRSRESLSSSREAIRCSLYFRLARLPT